MGNLINPLSVRLGYVRYWNSTWFTLPQLYSSANLINLKANHYASRLVKLVNTKIRFMRLFSFKILRNRENFVFALYFKILNFKYGPINEIVAALKNLWSYKFDKITKKIFFNKLLLNKNVSVVKLVRMPLKKNKFFYTNNSSNVAAIANLSYHVKWKKVASKIKKKIPFYSPNRLEFLPLARVFRVSLFSLTQLLDLNDDNSQIFDLEDSNFKETSKFFFSLHWCIFVLKSYIFYKLYIKKLKFFIKLSLQKFLGKNNLRIVFIKYDNFAITASMITRYMSFHLKAGFPVRQLVSSFVNYMKKEITSAHLVGFKIMFSGRFERRGRASYIWRQIGKVPNTNFEISLDYSLRLVVLTNSICAIKLWLSHLRKPMQVLFF